MGKHFGGSTFLTISALYVCDCASLRSEFDARGKKLCTCLSHIQGSSTSGHTLPFFPKKDF